MIKFVENIYDYNKWKNRLSNAHMIKIRVSEQEFEQIKPFSHSNKKLYESFKNKKWLCFKYLLEEDDIRYAVLDLKEKTGYWCYKDIDKLKKCFKIKQKLEVKFELNGYYKNLENENTEETTRRC